MKKILFFLMALSSMLFLVNTTFMIKSDSDYTISGIVKTKDSTPVGDIRVELLYGERLIQSDHTNNNGYYEIEEDDLRENTEYSIRVLNNRIQTKIINFETTQLEITIDIIVNQNPTANMVFPEIGYVNELITFSASASSDPDNDDLQYNWGFGDGGVSQGEVSDHAYSTYGEYVVTLEVTDSDGASDMVQSKIKIVNRSPVASINGPYIGRIGSKIQFSSEYSYDPDSDLLEYHWDFGDKTQSAEPNPQHIYNKIGTYNVKLTVTDIHGAKDEDETKCQILENLEPIAKANGPYSGYLGIPIDFSSSGSYDLDGTIQNYLWEFSDGQQSSESSPSIAFKETGNYTVSLTVTDNDGVTDSDIATIKVQVPPKFPPIAISNGPYSGYTGELIAFSSSGSHDPDGDSLIYNWSFGDGEISNDANPRYRYSFPGTYTVTLTVSDSDNETSTSTTSSTINKRPPPQPSPQPPSINHAPIAVGEVPKTGEIEQDIQFNSSGSHDPDGVINQYIWSFGDGENSYEKDPIHVYIEPGLYQVSLTVIDNEGKKGTYVSDIGILKHNLPPVIEVTGNVTASVDEVIQFSSMGSYDPDGVIKLYIWDFGDNETSNLENPDHVYTKAGMYNVSITFIDDYNASSQMFSTVIIKENKLPTPIIESLNNTKVGQVIEFSAQSSYDEDGEIIDYLWEFDDGNYSGSELEDHVYLEDGEKEVKLTVTDNNRGKNQVSKKIQVNYNIPPDIHTADLIIGKAQEKLLFKSESVDQDGEIISTLWDFGDGETYEGSLTYHSYEFPGKYFGKIVVTDDSLETSIKNILIVVNEPPAETVFPFWTLSVTVIISISYLFREPLRRFIRYI